MSLYPLMIRTLPKAVAAHGMRPAAVTLFDKLGPRNLATRAARKPYHDDDLLNKTYSDAFDESDSLEVGKRREVEAKPVAASIASKSSNSRRLSEHAVVAESLSVGDEEHSLSQLALTEVQATCLFTSYLRHLETQRDHITSSEGPKSIIQDNFASILLEKLAPRGFTDQFHSNPALDTFIHHLATRTRAIDDFLLDPPTTPHHQRQVVNLGAGMCTRPYRLDLLQDTTFYEVENDLHLLKAKRHALNYHRPHNQVVDVEGNVCDMQSVLDNLQTAGFDPDIPTDWVTEGLLEYLPPENRWQIFQHTRIVSAPHSRLIAFYISPYARDYCRDILKFLPPIHEDVSPKARVLEEMIKAGWGENINVIGDAESYARYQRCIHLPWFVFCAEPSS
jgi:methyltransferase (TIGR00027 family)